MPTSSHTIQTGNRLDSVSVWEFRDNDIQYIQRSLDIVSDPAEASFWAAGDGKVFLLKAAKDCIAGAEAALHGLGLKNVYAIWAYKNPTNSQWNTWSKKWAKRTQESVRFI